MYFDYDGDEEPNHATMINAYGLYHNDEIRWVMKQNRKKNVLTVLLIFVLLYLSVSVYLSVRTYYMVEATIHDEYNEGYQKIISIDLFKELDIFDSIKEDDVKFLADYSVRWFVTYHWFTKAKCVFWYDCESYSELPTNNYSGSARIPVTVTMEFKSGRWIVVDIFEPY